MKLPFNFNLSLFFRLLLPGFFVSLAFFPLIRLLCVLLSGNIDIEYILTISTILIGWFFVVADMNIYMVLEGRRYWPNILYDLFLNFEKKRLNKLKDDYEKAKINKDIRRRQEISVELRKFPINEDGDFMAAYPTRLGNLIAEYEDYPKSRYGINSIFYWYRIWLIVDNDNRKLFEDRYAIADSAIYMTIALFIDALMASVYAIIKGVFNISTLQTPEISILLIVALISFVGAFLSYRVSLYEHASLGEHYKSIFDVYGEKLRIENVINKISQITRNDAIVRASKEEQFRAVWMYLKNYRVTVDGKVVTVPKLLQDQQHNDNEENRL